MSSQQEAAGAPVDLADARFGDVACYTGHVMLCLGFGICTGASGGRAHTVGNDAAAFVRPARITYRSDFIGIRRFT